MQHSLICALALCSVSTMELARVLNSAVHRSAENIDDIDYEKSQTAHMCNNPPEHEHSFCPNGTLTVRIGDRVHTIEHITICGMKYDHQSICTLLEGMDLSVKKGSSHLHFAAGDNRLTVSNEDAERIRKLLTETKEHESGIDVTGIRFHVKLTGMLGMLLPNEGTCDLRFCVPKETEKTIAKASIPTH